MTLTRGNFGITNEMFRKPTTNMLNRPTPTWVFTIKMSDLPNQVLRNNNLFKNVLKSRVVQLSNTRLRPGQTSWKNGNWIDIGQNMAQKLGKTRYFRILSFQGPFIHGVPGGGYNYMNIIPINDGSSPLPGHHKLAYIHQNIPGMRRQYKQQFLENFVLGEARTYLQALKAYPNSKKKRNILYTQLSSLFPKKRKRRSRSKIKKKTVVGNPVVSRTARGRAMSGPRIHQPYQPGDPRAIQQTLGIPAHYIAN
jgi:hypothetical protein